ncbi:membrane protein insertase YidC [Aestuariibius sp. HNIBRBA575]|uniref:membrane protein insertase YidC n=1 Tax=Aestuariibius sp. HNIBRBA575 TaxID=3233343 RepID=UPI0034A45C7B
MDDQNKNLILATVLSGIVILVWFVLFPPEEVATVEPATDIIEQVVPDGAVLPTVETTNGTPATAEVEDAPEAPRLTVETPSLTGTISLQGGRIDDLSLVNYRETLDEDSDLVRMLSPLSADAPYYALFGWAPGAGVAPDAVPGPNTIWNVEAGETLTPETPVTLVWDNGAGLTFRRAISVDENFMFSIEQSIENASGAAVTMAPYGIIARHGDPDGVGFFIQHEGVVRMADGVREEIKYDDMQDLDADPRGQGVSEIVEVTENGWIGFTDQYWMTALLPSPGTAFRSAARYTEATAIYQTETIYPTRTIEPGATSSAESNVFAGAQKWETIREYQNKNGFERFLDAIDWGWFFFLTKPIFALLHFIDGLIGNMGWSIILLTLIIKAVLLPLAYKSYVSMAKMKELQPEMEALKAEAGDNREKMQKGMMELYKKNKVNPASGCLPILLQIPIFFSLYKVIFVTIELRHAEWIGWIHDLSAPDPSSILNLFGLLAFTPPEPGTMLAYISLGILPILLGISMFLQQKLNPAPTDPTQKMIFAWMPWVFMFMLGNFASGLVLYWIANNTITFIQQYLIMRSQGYRPDLIGNILGNRSEAEKK